ncbi:hypothetical protein [Leptospira interrogans]|uniref:Tail sheath protein subtilisin-like domain-containing protein n=1 Tax=Leptospira interrogans serovar Bataviae TaxID=312175 RepID=A0AAP9WP48_LEPIR|nr:hypothetical protein [Leptospira interrogans]EMN92982.1 hypothetical protein LEP1GSC110_0222 [Leptospira interrogans serovar Medanensis str. UT053]MCL8311331.1 hypothetical protein [Leptospira interrogans]MCR8639012.1 hypothetical protein [Leptospira interrogans serovar Ricardi]QOI53171.1 hypothetical protein Lepto1489_22655 [Leptospira interrogans serovar Bataviae]
MGAREVEFLGRGYIQPGARGAFRTKPQTGGISPDFTTLVLIGSADNGYFSNDSSLPISKRVLEFSGPDEARSVLGSGDLTDAVINSFSPSKDSRFANGPQTIKTLNVSRNLSASVSVLSITTGISNIIKAQVPGPKGNQIRFRITNNGTVIQVGDKDGIVSSAPIEANEFRIQYIGNAETTNLTFDGTTLQVILSGASATDGSLNLNVPVKDYETISELVAYINSQSGYSAILLSQPDRKTKTLDYISTVDAVDIKSGYTLRSLLYWQETFFLTNGLAEIELGSQRKPCADMASFSYLYGGATGTATATDFLNAIDTVFDTELIKGFYVNVCTSLETVRLYLADKLSNGNSPEGSDERFGGAGLDLARTIDQRIDDIKATNSEYLVLGFSPITRYASDRITLKTYPGWMLAVLHNAIKASGNVRETATYKDLNIVDAPEILSKTQIKKILRAGGLVVTRKPNNGPFKIEFALTSYQSENLIKNQASTVCTALALVKDFREWLNVTFTGEVPTDPNALGTNLTDADIRTAVTQRFRNVYISQFGWLTRNIYTGEDAFDENFDIRRDGDVVYFVFPNGLIVTPINFMFFLLQLDVIRGASKEN